MELIQYPRTISDVSKEILSLEVELRGYQAHLDRLTLQIEKRIAKDDGLKNEQQRKSARMELTCKPEYTHALEQVQATKDQIDDLRIDLQFYRDSFRVALTEANKVVDSTNNNIDWQAVRSMATSQEVK